MTKIVIILSLKISVEYTYIFNLVNSNLYKQVKLKFQIKKTMIKISKNLEEFNAKFVFFLKINKNSMLMDNGILK